jgi:hypothetical protein
MYETLSKPWQICVDLAWEAYCAGRCQLLR